MLLILIQRINYSLEECYVWLTPVISRWDEWSGNAFIHRCTSHQTVTSRPITINCIEDNARRIMRACAKYLPRSGCRVYTRCSLRMLIDLKRQTRTPYLCVGTSRITSYSAYDTNSSCIERMLLLKYLKKFNWIQKIWFKNNIVESSKQLYSNKLIKCQNFLQYYSSYLLIWLF